MNTYFLIAALLTFLMGLSHSVMGERFFLVRLFKREPLHHFGDAVFVNRTTRIAWHLTTIAWWNAAAILMVFTFRELDNTVVIVGRIVSNIFLLSGILSLIGSRGRHLSWVIFFLISLVSWLGTS
jgi:hypothetical protein